MNGTSRDDRIPWKLSTEQNQFQALTKPGPPVVLVKALITFGTYIPFSEIPQHDPKPLKQNLDQALFELNDLD